MISIQRFRRSPRRVFGLPMGKEGRKEGSTIVERLGRRRERRGFQLPVRVCDG